MWYRALVVDASDPLNKGRVRLRIPQLYGGIITNWAEPVRTDAATIPVHFVGEEVWASMEGGDKNYPIFMPLISNRYLSGAGTPVANYGRPGDYYFDTVSANFFGPKTLAGWGTPRNLVGPQGPTGLTGPTGATGSTGPAGPGLAAGGTTNQVPFKNSATDYDTAWADLDTVVQNGGSGLSPLLTTWTSYTPTLTSGTAPNPTLGTGGSVTGRYLRVGKTTILQGQVTWGTSYTQPGADFRVGLPNTVSTSGIGTVYWSTANTNPNLFMGVCFATAGTTYLTFRVPSSSTVGDLNSLSNGTFPFPSIPYTFTSGDDMYFAINYQNT